MLGASEPRLARVPAARVARLRDRVDVARLRTDVERLDEPRGRQHAPEAMERAERYVTDQLEQAGWSVRRRHFADGLPGVTGLFGSRALAEELVAAGRQPDGVIVYELERPAVIVGVCCTPGYSWRPRSF